MQDFTIQRNMVYLYLSLSCCILNGCNRVKPELGKSKGLSTNELIGAHVGVVKDEWRLSNRFPEKFGYCTLGGTGTMEFCIEYNDQEKYQLMVDVNCEIISVSQIEEIGWTDDFTMNSIPNP